MSTGPMTDVPTADQAVEDDDELGWAQEGLFVRDLEGRLIRYDKPTREELDRKVKLTVDGEEIEVYKAVPATDEMGNPLYDEHGLVIPRATTIYDAVSQRYEQRAGMNKETTQSDGGATVPRQDDGPGRGTSQTEEFKRMAGDSLNPIPILCHMKYMKPVAVCRVCVVQIAKFRRRAKKTEVDEEKLWPACQHRVEEEMIVHTIASPDLEARARIEKAVKTLLALLMADHPTPCAKEQQIAGECELEALAKKFGVVTSAFDRRPKELLSDSSSLAIAVDHNACILCDRCIRGCNVIQKNDVLGRMGKGYDARIAFDLDVSMGRSTCVACGECMVSCPTGALTFKDKIAADWFEEERPDGSAKSRGRREGWLDWLTFGLRRRRPRPVQRSQTGASSSDEGAARR